MDTRPTNIGRRPACSRKRHIIHQRITVIICTVTALCCTRVYVRLLIITIKSQASQLLCTAVTRRPQALQGRMTVRISIAIEIAIPNDLRIGSSICVVAIPSCCHKTNGAAATISPGLLLVAIAVTISIGVINLCPAGQDNGQLPVLKGTPCTTAQVVDRKHPVAIRVESLQGRQWLYRFEPATDSRCYRLTAKFQQVCRQRSFVG